MSNWNHSLFFDIFNKIQTCYNLLFEILIVDIVSLAHCTIKSTSFYIKFQTIILRAWKISAESYHNKNFHENFFKISQQQIERFSLFDASGVKLSTKYKFAKSVCPNFPPLQVPVEFYEPPRKK